MASTVLTQLSFRSINRFHSLTNHTSHINYASIQLLQINHFATRQRPKSITSLSNPNRDRSNKSEDDTITDWSNYDVQLFQYYHDPRSSQFRIILDYFSIPYDCIEVTPFRKMELSTFQIPEEHHHAPLLKMAHRTKLKETGEQFKQEAVLYIPSGYRSETLKIGNVQTFRERIKKYINKHEAKTEGIIFLISCIFQKFLIF